jgi:anti-sigma B factor antagonist
VETLIGVLVSGAAAENAIAELLRIPVAREAITFFTADPDLAARARNGAGLAGILGGAVTMQVPGVGPVLAIGTGATNLLGQDGSDDAQFFHDVLRKGRSLVIVRTESKLVAEAACAVLDRLGIGTRRGGEAGGEVLTRASVRHFDGIAIVDLSGRITLGEGGAMLRDTVTGLIEQGQKKIMLNLRRVTYVDSSGIGELVRALGATRGRGGELKLVSVSQPVNEVLKITRLATLFDVAQDESAGAKSFRASA